jgi:hypothetical protein
MHAELSGHRAARATREARAEGLRDARGGQGLAWRARGVVAAADGRLRRATSITLHEAASQLIEGMQRGSVRTRSGAAYSSKSLDAPG